MKNKIKAHFAAPFAILILFAACTFDYGESSSSERELPDLVMENVEYIRVRSSDPIARFIAERAERYDRQGIMKLQNFSFEQYGDRGEEVNAIGNAGSASVDIDSGDVLMTRGVRLEVESEDIVIVTNQLEWKDELRLLSSGSEDNVNILRENGTSFTGVGLRADTRRRSFEFSGTVSGLFVHVDAEDAHESTAEP